MTGGENLLNLSYLANDSIGAVFASFAPYLIVTLFMSFAAVQVLKTGAAGASAITGLAAKVGGQIKKGGKALAKYGGQKARSTAQRMLEKSAAKSGLLSKAVPILTGKDQEGSKRSRIAKFAARNIFRPAVAGFRVLSSEMQEDTAKLGKEIEGKVKGKEIETQRRFWKDTKLPQKLAHLIKAFEEGGDFSDVVDMKNAGERKKVKQALGYALKNEPELFKKIRLTDWQDKYKTNEKGELEKDSQGNYILEQKSLLHEIMDEYKDKIPDDKWDRAGLKLDDEDKAFYGRGENKYGKVINEGINKALGPTDEQWTILSRKIIGSLKSGDIQFMSKGSQLNMITSDDFQVLGNQAQIAKVAENFAREAVDALNIIVGEKMKQNPSFYKTYNTRLDKYFTSTPSRTLGIQYEPGGAATEQNQEIAKLEKEYNDLKEDMARAVGIGNQNQIDAVEKQRSDMQQRIADLKQKIAQQEEEAKRTAEEEKRKREEAAAQEQQEEERKKQQKKFKGMGRRRI